MRSIFTFIAVAACFTTACKKDTPEPEKQDEKPVPKEVISELTEELSGADSISSFVAAFGDIQLTEAEVSEGLTVFAPLNQEGTPASGRAPQGPGTKRPATKASGIDTKAGEEMVIKDHVVKGIFGLADLTDGKTLTSLSGKELKVTKADGQTWINGVAMSGDGIVTADGQMVFVVKQSLTGTTVTDEPEPETISLIITVWDATGWTPSVPDGVPAAGADVDLYKSREDYAASNPAYSGEAGEDGKVTFEDIEPGTYYIYAGLDYMSNIILESDQPENGVFTGMGIDGIFDTETELPPGELLGNFRYADVNADGQVNYMDRTPVPFESATIGGASSEMNVYIGYINNQGYKPRDEAGIQALLGEVVSGVSSWHKWQQVMLDALLSDDVDALPGGVNNLFMGIDNFSFNAAHGAIAGLWRGGFDHIFRLNRIIWEIENSSSGYPALLGQAKAMRGYVYLQLVNYFGEVPVAEGIVWQEADFDFDTDREGLYSMIASDLEEARSLLPETSTDKSRLTTDAVKALQAKLAMIRQDFSMVAQLTNEITGSSSYNLEVGEAAIFADGSGEFIWNGQSGMAGEFKQFFDNRENCPYLRITEIYLMRAEALLHQGDLNGAYEIISMLSARADVPPPTMPFSTAQLRVFLHGLWKAEMSKEGSRYVNLQRWGEAESVLGPKGYQFHHMFLPIPQYFIDEHPQAVQNPGY